ncbi:MULTISPECIES: dihydropteroate synthase [Dyella]|uniref:Dihydropteroate synthase n=2 Tax=Dyella TaxID=231454 RepID=A0A4R0YTU0_9GAMM|nr:MULTISPECIES: dihydropteroate synthase [Dyella]TBR39603.1 dihydropteroate synthase [Dyella terrae]TCI12815.1 dihydropteroate synthase [Dyella soli]
MSVDLFAPVLDCAGRPLRLDRARVVGIVNVTPDSFSDGGSHATTEAAVAHGLKLAEEGADMLDVGGESTRPGAADVSVEDELRRVIPVIEQLAARTTLPIAVDTSKPEVMRAAVAAGAGMINDVYALRREGALDAVAELRVAVCLMHMQGEPRSMQDEPHYDDVVGDVHRFLTDRLFACELAGIDKRQVMVDPGFGFGKNLEHNLALLRATERFANLGSGVYIGLSRKSMIGEITGRKAPQDRAAGSVAAAMIAVQRGARIVRVHDVAATVDALAVWQAVAKGDAAPRRDDRPAMPRWPDDE